MKKLLPAIILLAGLAGAAHAQKKQPVLAPSYAWKIVEPLGLREEATIDTLPDNYGQRTVPSLSLIHI